MTSRGVQVEALATAVENVQASEPPQGGRIPVPGFDPSKERCQVRHLVIFRAAIVGYTRPAADGA
ncbi:MAG TPA: hypothetical protein VFH30_13650 [Acidimicrobiales bacterium]|nr:hypothetical protein [Acidimicrobiales bacterium]